MHAGCGLEQGFIGTIDVRDAPDKEHLLRRRTRRKTVMKTMMCRGKKKNEREREREREEIHVFGNELMVRMTCAIFGSGLEYCPII